LKIIYKASIIAITIIAVIVAAYLYIRWSSLAPFKKFGDAQVGDGEVEMMFLGTSAFIIRTSHHTIIIDPATKIPTDALGSLGAIDAILITHEHSDHFDASATFDLHHASEAVVVANEGAYQSLEGLIHRADKLILLRPGENASIEGIAINALASNHTAISPLMYVIRMDAITILHASDSGYEPALEAYKGKIEIAILPTGGASPTASPSQAFKMAEAVLPKEVIPMHGTSTENDELRSLLASLPGVNFMEIQALSPQLISLP
jgi:L-ascorbate metabolism protein UlaG (beta-lactamase superfamily)